MYLDFSYKIEVKNGRSLCTWLKSFFYLKLFSSIFVYHKDSLFISICLNSGLLFFPSNKSIISQTEVKKQNVFKWLVL